MGDPEAENLFARAREIHRRTLKRRPGKTIDEDKKILAGAMLRAPVQPLPSEPERRPPLI